MKLLIACIVVLFTPFAFHAQTEVDLYRFSNTFYEGSARFEAMGGSFGALGAEMGAARINPAGFARYSSSQFAFGLSSISITNNSAFNATDLRSTDYKMRLSNLGLVLTSDLSDNRGGFLYQQIGIGYNSIANFGNDIKYTGQQYASLLDGFAAQASGIAPADLSSQYPFSSSLAYETYAINPSGSDYVPELNAGNVIHTREILSKGGMGEMHFSYSANYLNKLYIGANVGVQFLRYSENLTHHEEVTDTTNISLRSFDYLYNLKTRGNGTNLKLGVIYLPVESLRLGLAIHTPTFFELTDNWNADMTAIHDTITRYVPEELKPSADYKYRMRTPARIIGSFAYVFGARGCINIDLEYLDYRWAHFKSTTDVNYASYDYAAENEAADQRFKAVLNTRIGGELVIMTNYFIRAGLGFFPKGDKNLTDFGGKFDTSYSGGIGVRLNNCTLDASVRSFNQTRTYFAFENSATDISTRSLYIAVNFQVKF